MYNVNVKTSSLDAEVVSELILGGGAREIVERKRLLLMEANDLFDRLFPGMPPGFPYPLFRWVPIDLPGRPDEIEARFRAAGVRVYHGDRFRVSGEAKEGFLRVSLSTWESPRRFERGLRALRSVLAAEGEAAGRRASRLMERLACLAHAPCPRRRVSLYLATCIPIRIDLKKRDETLNPLLIIMLVLLVVSGLGLIVFILLHSGKGTGISDMIASSVYSTQTGTSIVEKNLDRITIIFAIVFMVSLIVLMIIYPHGTIAAS